MRIPGNANTQRRMKHKNYAKIPQLKRNPGWTKPSSNSLYLGIPLHNDYNYYSNCTIIIIITQVLEGFQNPKIFWKKNINIHIIYYSLIYIIINYYLIYYIINYAK